MTRNDMKKLGTLIPKFGKVFCLPRTGFQLCLMTDVCFREGTAVLMFFGIKSIMFCWA